jgi:putative nucleotidyltransferase with HDIG domain
MLQPWQKESIKKAILDTPLLSPSTAQLLELIAQPDYELDEVIRIVKHDAPLTARLLKVVNSPVYRPTHPITSVDRAVVFLGSRVVVSVAISSSTGTLLTGALSGYEGEQYALWRHNLFCALASRAVARFGRGACPPDAAFTAGLLHDIGKGVLSQFLQGSSAALLAKIGRGEVADYLQAEGGLLGQDHTQVGFELARHWKLPLALQQTIHHHHHPERAGEEFRALTYAVHLGDLLAMMAGYGTGSDSLQYALAPDYIRYFPLTEDDLARVLLEVSEEFIKLSQSFENL